MRLASAWTLLCGAFPPLGFQETLNREKRKALSFLVFCVTGIKAYNLRRPSVYQNFSNLPTASEKTEVVTQRERRCSVFAKTDSGALGVTWGSAGVSFLPKYLFITQISLWVPWFNHGVDNWVTDLFAHFTNVFGEHFCQLLRRENYILASEQVIIAVSMVCIQGPCV